MKKIFAFAFLAAVAASRGFADAYADMEKYSAGGSLAWYHALAAQAQKPEAAREMSAALSAKIAGAKLSPEAFRLACALLKPVADCGCVDALKPYLLDDVRCPYACGVLIALDCRAADAALAEALAEAMKLKAANADKNALPNVAKNIVSAIAARGKDISSVIAAANSKDAQLALFAVEALARFRSSGGLLSIFETSPAEALNEIAAKGDFRKAAAVRSLELLALAAMAADNKEAARQALKFVPANSPNAVAVRAYLMNPQERVKYLDGLIAEGGALTDAAGKAMNDGRTFENSQWLLSKFPSLNRKAKLAAMGSFMVAADTRFYPAIAAELDNPDPDIRALAIYSARFLCSDDANFLKIYAIFKDGSQPMCNYAENVLLENPSFAVRRVLKEKADAGDLQALELLVRRGDDAYKAKLWQAFLDEKTRTSAISRVLENTLASGDVEILAKHYRRGDEALSKEITKIIIKKMAQYRASPQYVAMAVKRALEGNLDRSDPNFALIVNKLKIGEFFK